MESGKSKWKYKRVYVTNITNHIQRDMGCGMYLHSVICDCRYDEGEPERQKKLLFTSKQYESIITNGYSEIEVYDDS